ncbi:glutamine synthetase [Streptomyces sp. SB3404]|uniref:Glutamine synthetase n=1 Tax=Streptomyces boncukensis TaxID=2711219 RepID=A0A6G4WYC6_9ACTN|nr:glutamine synthetase family protein [Streptomyces boncukensis]NGO70299.1 glutamine synthetase [Streptomyces boncukensis]
MTLEELRGLADARRIETVLLALPDLQGRLKGKRHGVRAFLDQVAAHGAEACAYVLATDVDMRPLPGYALASWETGYQDLRVRPDLDTLRTVPWLPRTALVHGDALAPESGQPLAVAPRRLLRRELDQLAGLGLRVQAGLETEFALYRGSYAQAAEQGFHGLVPAWGDNLDYALDHPPVLDRYLRRLSDALDGAGLPVEALKTESAPGQVEITFPYGDALAACDGHTVFKHAARVVGERTGLAATFMAAPETGTGNGLHLHLSLWRGEHSALNGAGATGHGADTSASGTSDASGASGASGRNGGLSPLGERAVAGLLDALPQLAPLYAPTVNSYRRFRPDSFAPTHFTWGRDNRTCAVRVTGQGAGLHLEVRLPGADANPYLALAAALAAVRHGLTGDLPLPHPHTGSAYAQARGEPPVPVTLEQALAAFRGGPLARELLGAEAVAHYAYCAETEVAAHRYVVTDAERVRGFSRA